MSQDEISFDTLAADFGIDDRAYFSEVPSTRIADRHPMLSDSGFELLMSRSSFDDDIERPDRFFADPQFDAAVSSPSPGYMTRTRPQQRAPPSASSDFFGLAPPSRLDPSARRPPSQLEASIRRDRPAAQQAASNTGIQPADAQQTGLHLLPVSALPAQYRSLYSFGLFNTIQTRTFEAAFRSDKNLIMCAPTGSGKTVIFELAILRMLMQSGQQAQAVYLAPTRALVAERVRDWGKRFGTLGITVAELTGDTSSRDLGAAKKARVIVATPEKWDAITRRTSDEDKVLPNVGLVLIDEIHSLRADVRGPRLEAVVARFKLHGRARLIALSATVPNIADIAEWVGTDPTSGKMDKPAKTFNFDESFRPVPLTKLVFSYNASETSGFKNGFNKYLMELIRKHGKRKSTLIFLPTRNATIACATALAKEYDGLKDSPARLPWPRPSAAALSTFEHGQLGAVVKAGVAFHHAGLSHNDRKQIEQDFLNGRISVLGATTTLATGVNLPAHLVIVRGTQIFDEGEWKEMSDLDIIQMLGRAGRPGFDREGCAIIMCEHGMKDRYTALASGQTVIESKLGSELKEHLIAEIGLRGGADIEALMQWLRATFFYVRASKDPAQYFGNQFISGGDTPPAARLRQMLQQTVDELRESGLLCEEKDQDRQLLVSDFGDIMSKHFIKIKSILSLKEASADVSSLKQVLEHIANAPELAELRLRRGDKEFYDELRQHQDIRFPPKGTSSNQDKVLLLMQAALAGIDLDSIEAKATQGTPALDLMSIFRAAPRLANALLDIAIADRNGPLASAAFEVARALHARAWETSPAVLRQLDGVGDKTMRRLVMSGHSTIRKVAEADAPALSATLSRNTFFGHKLVASARRIPELTLSMKTMSTKQLSGSLFMRVEVCVGLVRTEDLLMKSKENGAPVYVAVLTTLSDKTFADFRRISLKTLARSKTLTFTLECKLTKPSQRIVSVAACDCIAGTAMRAELRPDPSDVSTLVEGAGVKIEELHESAGEQEKKPRTTHTKTAEPPSKPSSVKSAGGKSAGRTTRTEEEEPAQSDAKCKHPCKDKSSCGHLCCKVGAKGKERANSGKGGGKPARVSSGSAAKGKTGGAGDKKRKQGFLSDESSDDEFDDDALDAMIARIDDSALYSSLFARSGKGSGASAQKKPRTQTKTQAHVHLPKPQATARMLHAKAKLGPGRPSTESFVKSLASDPTVRPPGQSSSSTSVSASPRDSARQHTVDEDEDDDEAIETFPDEPARLRPVPRASGDALSKVPVIATWYPANDGIEAEIEEELDELQSDDSGDFDKKAALPAEHDEGMRKDDGSAMEEDIKPTWSRQTSAQAAAEATTGKEIEIDDPIEEDERQFPPAHGDAADHMQEQSVRTPMAEIAAQQEPADEFDDGTDLLAAFDGWLEHEEKLRG